MYSQFKSIGKYTYGWPGSILSSWRLSEEILQTMIEYTERFTLKWQSSNFGDMLGDYEQEWLEMNLEPEIDWV